MITGLYTDNYIQTQYGVSVQLNRTKPMGDKLQVCGVMACYCEGLVPVLISYLQTCRPYTSIKIYRYIY